MDSERQKRIDRQREERRKRTQSRNSSNRGRNRFLGSVAAVLLAIGAGAGLNAVYDKFNNQSSEITSTGAQASLKDSTYPEIEQLPVKGSGRIATPLGRIIDWWNYSDYKFNAQNAKDLYALWESIGVSNNVAPTIESGGRKIQFTVGLPTERLPAILYVVPERAPLPTWMLQGQGATYLREEFPYKVSVIREINVLSEQEDKNVIKSGLDIMNRAMVGESVNQILLAIGSDGNFSLEGQEVFNNSLARLLAAKYAGVTYQDYVRSVQNKGVSIATLGPIPIIVFPPDQYNINFPGPILTKS